MGEIEAKVGRLMGVMREELRIGNGKLGFDCDDLTVVLMVWTVHLFVHS